MNEYIFEYRKSNHLPFAPFKKIRANSTSEAFLKMNNLIDVFVLKNEIYCIEKMVLDAEVLFVNLHNKRHNHYGTIFIKKNEV